MQTFQPSAECDHLILKPLKAFVLDQQGMMRVLNSIPFAK